MRSEPCSGALKVSGRLLAHVTVLWFVGCAPHVSENRPASSAPLAAQYIVAGSAAGAPPSCDIGVVSRRAADFFAAVTEGTANVAEQFFTLGTNAPFQWFSFSDREPGGLDYSTNSAERPTPADLNANFRQRHSAGNRLDLRGIDFIGWVPERNTVAVRLYFAYSLPNRMGGNQENWWGTGKAEYHCDTSKFAIMSLGLMENARWHEMFRRLSNKARAQSTERGGGAPGAP